MGESQRGGETVTEQRTLLNADEFFRLYSGKEGDYELVRGELIEMPPPGGVHGGVAVNIASALHTHVRQHDLGRVVVESGFTLEREPDTVRGPDVAFIMKEHLSSEGLPRAFVERAPDLAVEVVSPSDTAAQLENKVHDYLRSGTQQVWLVYPDSRRVVVYGPEGVARWYGEGDTLQGRDLLPGFSMPLGEFFV
jgi:Uma2 family endonuclease